MHVAVYFGSFFSEFPCRIVTFFVLKCHNARRSASLRTSINLDRKRPSIERQRAKSDVPHVRAGNFAGSVVLAPLSYRVDTLTEHNRHSFHLFTLLHFLSTDQEPPVQRSQSTAPYRGNFRRLIVRVSLGRSMHSFFVCVTGHCLMRGT